MSTSIQTTIAAPAQTHKTRICIDFSKGGCPRGDDCTFAHGDSELVKGRCNWSSKECKYFNSDKGCKFVHEDLVPKDLTLFDCISTKLPAIVEEEITIKEEDVVEEEKQSWIDQVSQDQDEESIYDDMPELEQEQPSNDQPIDFSQLYNLHFQQMYGQLYNIIYAQVFSSFCALELTLKQKHQIFGESILAKVKELNVPRPNKITGMILEMPASDINRMLYDQNFLMTTVDQAVKIFQEDIADLQEHLNSMTSDLNNITISELQSSPSQKLFKFKISAKCSKLQAAYFLKSVSNLNDLNKE